MDELLVRRLPQPPTIEEGHSGYFSAPEARLDPRLFDGDHIKPAVREALLGLLSGFWKGRGYKRQEAWSTAWVAGSGVSYQWHGDRGGVGDLDVLVGVDMPRFFQSNEGYQGVPEDLVAKRFNNEFNTLLQPGTKLWRPPGGGAPFEVTFYVNPGAADIRDIQPYAAYDLTHDTWTVHPASDPTVLGGGLTVPDSWGQQIAAEVAQGRALVERYAQASERLSGAPVGSPAAVNAGVGLNAAAEAAGALYEDIHNGRKHAFGPGGKGYGDWYNYRWQAHKRAGTEQALRAIHDGRSAAIQAVNTTKYGMADLSADRAILNASMAPHGRRGLL